MNLLTREDLTELMEKHDDTCITIYLPTFRAGVETKQGRIRLKNLLGDAETQLLQGGMRSPEVKHFLRPINDLILDNLFWQQQRDGLAIFLSSDMFYYYRVPMNLDDFLLVGRRFHLKPLLPLLNGDGLFYVLALSLNDVRVLQCTRASVMELDIDDIPHSMAESMKYDDPERQLQLHSNTLKGTERKAAAIYNGHGTGIDDSKENILRYFRLIDRGLHHVLREEKAPLILAGVDYLFPIYQEANTYTYLSEKGIPGNPEELSAEDLQTLAWPVVEHYFHKAEQEALTYYGPLKGTDRTTQDITEAAPAAHNGQVEILFLANGSQQWGRFDPQINGVHLHEEPEPGDEELFDFTAMQTIINGGSVYVLDADKIPDGAPFAALLRY
ncbi:MAG TPA: hypothetical protein VHQ70_00745 [Syntrophomonadaceae bacterium]|nr:hypothetical protein [Syntrophomonadaceae bacterium]